MTVSDKTKNKQKQKCDEETNGLTEEHEGAGDVNSEVTSEKTTDEVMVCFLYFLWIKKL